MYLIFIHFRTGNEQDSPLCPPLDLHCEK
jgi:hypothetical protein